MAIRPNATPGAAAGVAVARMKKEGKNLYHYRLIQGVKNDIHASTGVGDDAFLGSELDNIPQNDKNTYVIALFASDFGFHFLRKIGEQWQ